MSTSRSYGPLLKALLAPSLREPHALDLRESRRETAVSLEFLVHPDDAPHVIGRHGSQLQALRTAMEFAARRHGDRLTLQLLDA